MQEKAPQGKSPKPNHKPIYEANSMKDIMVLLHLMQVHQNNEKSAEIARNRLFRSLEWMTNPPPESWPVYRQMQEIRRILNIWFAEINDIAKDAPIIHEWVIVNDKAITIHEHMAKQLRNIIHAS